MNPTINNRRSHRFQDKPLFRAKASTIVKPLLSCTVDFLGENLAGAASFDFRPKLAATASFDGHARPSSLMTGLGMKL